MALDINSILQAAGISGGLGSAGMGVAGLLGNKNRSNPSTAAINYLDKIPSSMRPYFDPYINAGQRALPQLQDRYSKIFSNPGQFVDELGSGFKESPGYQFALKQALQAGGNAAAAGGKLGTPEHQFRDMSTAEGLASQEFNNYLNNIFKGFGLGAQGLEDINKMGFGASTDFGNSMGNLLGQKAQYSYAGQAGQNRQKSGNWANIFSGVASALPWLFA